MPFGTNYTPRADLSPVDKPFVAGREDYTAAALITATPSIFTTLACQSFAVAASTARDLSGGTPVAVLSAVAARQLFGTADALGPIVSDAQQLRPNRIRRRSRH
jgi:hypothetical protein